MWFELKACTCALFFDSLGNDAQTTLGAALCCPGGRLCLHSLVESLGEVVEVYGSGRIPCTFVTPAGDVLTPDGVLRGGGDSSHTGIHSRVREVRELEGEVAGLQDRVGRCEREHREAEECLRRLPGEQGCSATDGHRCRA